MRKICFLPFILFISASAFGQKIEFVYLNAKDSSANMYIAVEPQNGRVTSFMFLLDGLGGSPQNVLIQTELPKYAAQKGILTIIPVLKTGTMYFGSDTASQQSLKNMIELVASQYQAQGKDFYIGCFSIGGTCAVKYAELAVQKNYPIKPKAVFAVDPPLDWQRFYDAARRSVRLSGPGRANGEDTYMIDRIKKEMGGTPEAALENFYEFAVLLFGHSPKGNKGIDKNADHVYIRA